MADAGNEFEARVAILERAVARLREQAALTSFDAAAARLLAAGADHDVSEVRSELHAHTRVLNALRVTQLEHGEAITGLRQDLAEQGRAIISLDQKMSAGFVTLNTGMAQIVTLLNGNAGSDQNYATVRSVNSTPATFKATRMSVTSSSRATPTQDTRALRWI